jgi:hypothetical protein
MLLRRLIEKRFGPMPQGAEDRLAACTAAQLEELYVRVLKAKTIEQLFVQHAGPALCTRRHRT